MNWKVYGRKRSWPNGDTIPKYVSVMIADVSVEIRNVYLLNTSPERYDHTNLPDHLITLGLLFLFWKKKWKWANAITVLSVSVSPLINFWVPELKFMKLDYVYQGDWAHLNDVLHKSIPLVCVSFMCIPFSLLGNGSVKCLSPFIAR
jgi:hypothetical protein